MENANEDGADLSSKVCRSAMLGDYEALTETIENHPELVNQADEQGHFPLHWAALNNRVAEVEFLLTKDAAVRARNPEGATALHWAVFRNSLPCIEALLRAGAEKEAQDSNGYQPCHIAAQWGHAAALFHLALRWDANFNAKDREGRSPLHWAAYKGFHDCARLLLVLGCSPHDTDVEGCNTLHWAALRGNSDAATVILQGGGLSLLTAADRLGNTPEQCAENSGHRMLSHFLRIEERKLRSKAAPRSKLMKYIHSMHFAPIIWISTIACMIVFFWKVLPASPSMPAPLPWMTTLAMICLLLSALGLVFMAIVNVSDPGYVPKRGEKPATKSGGRSQVPMFDVENLDCPALWSGRWEQLCVTCKIVRPLRAKHDEHSDRCIEVFDHFCPWVGNSIGKGNRHTFLAFVTILCVAMLIAYAVALGRLTQVGFFNWGPRHINRPASGTIWIILWPICSVPLLFSLVGLAVSQVGQVWQNVTTNELMNWHRYKHFRAPAEPGQIGEYRNPFDKGVTKNCHELCFPSQYPIMPTYLETNDLEAIRQKLHNVRTP